HAGPKSTPGCPGSESGERAGRKPRMELLQRISVAVTCEERSQVLHRRIVTDDKHRRRFLIESLEPLQELTAVRAVQLTLDEHLESTAQHRENRFQGLPRSNGA